MFGVTTITNTLMTVPVPVRATVRYLPLAEDARVHPYVGGGVGVDLWRVGYEDRIACRMTSDVPPCGT